MPESPNIEHSKVKPQNYHSEPKSEADKDMLTTTPKTSTVISDTLLNSILGLTGNSTVTSVANVTKTVNPISQSFPSSISSNFKRKPTDENIEKKLSSMIILLSAPPTPDQDTNDADADDDDDDDDDIKLRLATKNSLPKEDIIKILKLSLMKIKQLNLNVQCLKEDTTSKVERLELERDLLIKEINFICNRKLENTSTKEIQQHQSTGNNNMDSIDSAQLSPTNSPSRFNKPQPFHPETSSTTTKIMRKPAGQGYTFPKLHNFNLSNSNINSQSNNNPSSITSNTNKQIKIVSTDKLSSGRKSSTTTSTCTSQPSSPNRKRKESFGNINNTLINIGNPNINSSITNPANGVQFFHYYSKDAVVDVNDFQSLDNRRNRKRKRIGSGSVSEVPTTSPK